MADAIFISYRRDDSEGEAGRLFDDLTRAFGNDAVFMDVAGIKPGVDFREVIESNVAVCAVFLAIIGPSWATIHNAEGVRRLDDPKDFVALELGSALRRKVPVIPVLVHDAKMPAADLLPEQLKNFSYRNSVELSHTRWSSDVQLLIEALKPYIAPPKLAVQPPIHATIPVQLPPPNPAAFRIPPPPAKKSKTPLVLGISAAVFLVIVLLAVIGNLADKKDEESKETKNDSALVTQPGEVTEPQPQQNKQTVPPENDSQQPSSAITGPQHPGLSGSWKYPVERGGNSLSRLVISTSGTLTLMHPYGSCQPIECDWGTQPVIFNGPLATCVFRLDPYMDANGSLTQRMAKITAVPSSGNLNVVVQNAFQNATAGAYNNQLNLVLVPDE